MKVKDLKVGDFFVHPQSMSNPKCICLTVESTMQAGEIPYVVISGSINNLSHNMRGAISYFAYDELEQEVDKLDLNSRIDIAGLILSLFEQQAIDQQSVCWR